MADTAAPARAKPLLSWPFVLTLVAWAVLAAGSFVSFTWLVGLAPTPSLAKLFVGLFLIAPVSLWLWAASMAFRGSWRAALVRSACVITAAAALLVFATPLLDLGARVHFASERATYEEVLQKVRTEQPGPTWGEPLQWRGVRYRVARTAPPAVSFIWSDDNWSVLGVAYDEAACPPPTAKPPPQVAPGEPPALKHGGNLYDRVLSGHFCLLDLVG